MTASLLDRSLGDLARSIPGATALFDRHQLDFCCGGEFTLRSAAGPAAAQVAAELQALQAVPDEDSRDWRKATAEELIAHILRRYHERHRLQLPELVRLARRVETVHAARTDCPHGLADHLQTMQEALQSHMMKEEQVLFPALALGMAPPLRGPITVMRSEHELHGQALQRMADLAHGLVMPPGACNTWRALVLGLRELREDLMQHIHLENNVLFEGLNTPVNTGCGGGSGGGCGCGSRQPA